MDPSSRDDLILLEAAVREGARVALGYFGGDVATWQKDDASPVSDADIAVDETVRATLTKARPDYGWLSEESGRAGEGAHRTFVLDPIDGTRAFLAGRSGWALSLAVVEAGRPVAAAIFAPVRDEMLLASEGGGANVAGVPLRVTGARLSGATVAAPAALHGEGGLTAAGAQKPQWLSSLALRLAYVAMGRLDGVVTRPGPHHWDVAAGDLIVAEAGGVATDLSGAPLRYDRDVTSHGPVIAAGATLAPELRALAAAHHEATV